MLAPISNHKHHPIMYEVIACKRCAWAVLERAILDIVSKAFVPQHIRRDATTWLLQTDYEPFSYSWICEILDICPIKTREIIINLEAQTLMPGARSVIIACMSNQLEYLDAIQVHTYNAKVTGR